MTSYQTVVADPPWDHSDGTGMTLTVGMSSERHPEAGVRTVPYETQALDWIKALPVSEIVAADAHLYLWTTNRFLRDVWDVAESWGFQGVCIITWAKAYRGALGGGAWQSNTEFCLFARRGSLPTIGKARGRWYDWPRRFGPPVTKGERRNSMHSAKPEAFLDYVEQVSPGPYLELFARRSRLGWTHWGDESLEALLALKPKRNAS